VRVVTISPPLQGVTIMPKIVIEVWGGVVQAVLSDCDGLEVEIIDYDDNPDAEISEDFAACS
jgi:hypothetical protein